MHTNHCQLLCKFINWAFYLLHNQVQTLSTHAHTHTHTHTYRGQQWVQQVNPKFSWNICHVNTLLAFDPYHGATSSIRVSFAAILSLLISSTCVCVCVCIYHALFFPANCKVAKGKREQTTGTGPPRRQLRGICHMIDPNKHGRRREWDTIDRYDSWGPPEGRR